MYYFTMIDVLSISRKFSSQILTRLTLPDTYGWTDTLTEQIKEMLSHLKTPPLMIILPLFGAFLNKVLTKYQFWCQMLNRYQFRFLIFLQNNALIVSHITVVFIKIHTRSSK